ncbi:hypothetical protein HDU76_010290 [Blyttiomyces sp. JEL0837]|nr:hypothetical protein HDU76_010290 [Blyttiomyces sp. JEL0837]
MRAAQGTAAKAAAKGSTAFKTVAKGMAAAAAKAGGSAAAKSAYQKSASGAAGAGNKFATMDCLTADEQSALAVFMILLGGAVVGLVFVAIFDYFFRLKIEGKLGDRLEQIRFYTGIDLTWIPSYFDAPPPTTNSKISSPTTTTATAPPPDPNLHGDTSGHPRRGSSAYGGRHLFVPPLSSSFSNPIVAHFVPNISTIWGFAARVFYAKSLARRGSEDDVVEDLAPEVEEVQDDVNNRPRSSNSGNSNSGTTNVTYNSSKPNTATTPTTNTTTSTPKSNSSSNTTTTVSTTTKSPTTTTSSQHQKNQTKKHQQQKQSMISAIKKLDAKGLTQILATNAYETTASLTEFPIKKRTLYPTRDDPFHPELSQIPIPIAHAFDTVDKTWQSAVEMTAWGVGVVAVKPVRAVNKEVGKVVGGVTDIVEWSARRVGQTTGRVWRGVLGIAAGKGLRSGNVKSEVVVPKGKGRAPMAVGNGKM